MSGRTAVLAIVARLTGTSVTRLGQATARIGDTFAVIDSYPSASICR